MRKDRQTNRAGALRAAGAALAATGAMALVAGCGGNSGAGSPASAVPAGTEAAAAPTGQVAVSVVTLTDAGCPARLDVLSGPTTFIVRNDGATGVTEFEVLDGERVLGEVENVLPGLAGRFTVTLERGEYVTYCPGGATTERGVLAVDGGNVEPATEVSIASARAVSHYLAYVEKQMELLRKRTAAFTAALRAGDREQAKALYASTRTPYERIEPVADSFGKLDPAIDAREGDVPAAEWTGFHPIERLLWTGGGSQAELDALAKRLTADVKKLSGLVCELSLEPAQIANGSVELLGDVSKSKLTGEEERYSHSDLDDLAANVEGARAGFVAVRPLVVMHEPALATELDGRFAAVTAALEPYRRGDGFVAYSELTPADTRRLGRAIDALAAPLSRVAAIVVLTD